jgi:hypothetical protein
MRTSCDDFSCNYLELHVFRFFPAEYICSRQAAGTYAIIIYYSPTSHILSAMKFKQMESSEPIRAYVDVNDY